MSEIRLIPVDLIDPHPHNPRRDLGDLTELAASIEKLNRGIDELVAAKAAIEVAARELESLRVSRVDGIELDWEAPESLWLNAFACIHPSDAFAAEVGRSIIRTVMQAYPSRAAFTVRAS